MEDKALIKKYESFLKLNHLNISKESASDFIDLEGMGSLMELSMEYVRKGLTMQSKVTKNKYFINALIINPDNFLAKISIIENDGYELERYKEVLDIEYDRLLKNDFLEPKYYENNIVDFSKYQDTFNYIKGLRSYYISLVGNNLFEEAVKIGDEILELNPSDIFHIKSSLAFIYLSLGDTKEALNLFSNDNGIILGTRELVQAFVSYLNLEEKKSLDYLSDLEAVNPYLYRLITGEVTLGNPLNVEQKISDSIYVYLSFLVLGDLLDGFSKIVQKSKLEHPILKGLTKDELDILKVTIFENITYVNTEYIKREAKKYHLVDYVSSFSDGRMESIIVALTSRGILHKGQITTYGFVVRDALMEYLFNEAKRLKTLAEEAFLNHQDNLGIDNLLLALDYSPNDFYLKRDVLFHKSPFDFHYARGLIHELGVLYSNYASYTIYSEIKERQALEEILDEIHYRYYLEAYNQKGIQGLLDAYQKVENQFTKYTNLIQMAQYLNHEKLKDDSFHLFYTLYKEYKEKGKINYNKIIQILKKSKMEYADLKRGINRIPYRIIDEAFYYNYKSVLEQVPLDEILSKEEYETLRVIYVGGKLRDDARSSYSYLLNSRNLEKFFFLKSKRNKDEYELSDFVLDYFNKKK